MANLVSLKTGPAHLMLIINFIQPLASNQTAIQLPSITHEASAPLLGRKWTPISNNCVWPFVHVKSPNLLLVWLAREYTRDLFSGYCTKNISHFSSKVTSSYPL